ncbi:CAP domain-containing protein [Pseudanabaena mucicola]|uniref:SCP domain-containing protein n=1 Tax=Pseudanabaena mucicola FACHB-723 TaxID=2692860 RepID=A0ABR8A2G5_9CYAN|nr:CAP domain-containing protein [Pseudanabaena mucicola]MBD2189763.1 hypothetical protein [Pseudanabaena mucicola FACHB-723]
MKPNQPRRRKVKGNQRVRFEKKQIGFLILVSTLLLAAVTNAKYVGQKHLGHVPQAYGVVIPSSEDLSKRAIQEINTIRKKYGKPQINYSSKAYALAMARAKDMNEYGYYDHMNPKTKTCADTMKFSYGFKNDDYLAENINTYVATGGDYGSIDVQTMSDSIDAWMESRGHRFNLLYDMHLAGAVACDKNKCVFLGLNHEQFGKGCYTAKEGRAHWEAAPPQQGEVTPQQSKYKLNR